MKRYHIFSLLCILLVTFNITACKKGLEESPKTFVSPDIFFSNPDSYELAVVGIYTSLPLFSGNRAMLLEMCTDIYGTPSSAFEQALPTYKNDPDPSMYNTREAWSSAYAIIKNANFIIEQLPNGPLSDTKKNQLMGEARFLRAYAYFYLVQLYGAVPMPIKTAKNYSDLQAPRTSEAEVYNLILDDLTFAEANMPDDAAVKGRAYKLVSTALLAKVYLTMAGNPLKQTKYLVNARDKALAVINSKKFQLVADFAEVFHKTTYTTESIWEKLYETGRGGSPGHGLTVTAPGYTPILLPADWFINSFAKGDQRKEWGIVQNYKDPKGVVLNPFFRKFADVSVIDAGTTASAAIVNYTFPYMRLAEMYLIAAEAENEMNGPANAYQYINEIRKRARVNKADLTNVPDLTGLSKDQFRAAVLMERKWELCLEGSTWFDLKRTDNFQLIQTRRGSGLTNPIGLYNQTWLIPDNEVVNNNIAQNPRYH
uniref:RagB/SusD family nutrient uptake outer membrane protein n=1 Tax=Pedobacter schmidteae TaxID=2201271 RepID=UPI000EB4B3EF|nr:RagB/SusD family nutrient uptake outer membrane protein [Pedobacter schmidteae]